MERVIGRLAVSLVWLAMTACHSRSSGAKANAVDTTSIISGEHIYLGRCASCHGPAGRGVEGKFPPLAGVPWVEGSRTRLIALTLDGLHGERKVNKVEYHGVMPAWGAVLTAPEIAVLTYIRQAWGNNAPAISIGTVHQVRDRFRDRRTFWTEKELETIAAQR